MCRLPRRPGAAGARPARHKKIVLIRFGCKFHTNMKRCGRMLKPQKREVAFNGTGRTYFFQRHRAGAAGSSPARGRISHYEAGIRVKAAALPASPQQARAEGPAGRKGRFWPGAQGRKEKAGAGRVRRAAVCLACALALLAVLCTGASIVWKSDALLHGLDVVPVLQEPALPNGCEAASLASVLAITACRPTCWTLPTATSPGRIFYEAPAAPASGQTLSGPTGRPRRAGLLLLCRGAVRGRKHLSGKSGQQPARL